MDINQLRYFNSLAVTENMSKAAMALNVSQSTLSKSIGRLEDELGCPLFDRMGKRIKLNRAGKEFFEDSVRIVDRIEHAIERVHDTSNRIKICITGASKGIIKCIAEYEKISPTACFSLDSVLDIDEVPRISDYDVMLCPDSPRYNIYNGLKIHDDKMVLCVSKRHPYASKIAVSIKDLNGLDVVFIRKNGVIESVQAGLDMLSVRYGKSYYVSTRDLHRQMIAENIGVGYILNGASEFYASDDDLVIIPILDDRFTVGMKIVFRKDKHLSEEALRFKEFAIEFFKAGKDVSDEK